MTMKEYRVSDFKESSRRKGTIIHAMYRKPHKTWSRHVLLYKLENVIEGIRDLIGATDPSKAAERTVRKDFAESIRI